MEKSQLKIQYWCPVDTAIILNQIKSNNAKTSLARRNNAHIDKNRSILRALYESIWEEHLEEL